MVMMRANEVALGVERKRSEDYYGGVGDGVGIRGKGTQLLVVRNKERGLELVVMVRANEAGEG